jgi:HupE / UreJ protein
VSARRALLASLIIAALLGAADRAASHTGGSTGYATIAVEGSQIRYSLVLWPAAMPPAIADEIGRARGGDEASRERLLAAVRDKVSLVAGGRRCQAGAGSLPPAASTTESVMLVVEFACGAEVRELSVRDDLFDVFGADYHTLAKFELRGRTTQFAFAPDTRETRVAVDDGVGGRGLASFVLLGIEHILTGWDHLLFLFGLLLRGGSWLALAKIVTAFTVAHSITLALAALDLVVVPDRLVEAVIALSIAVVAAENLFLRPVVSRRWVVSFCFGLVHGFGFSSALRELGLSSHGLLLSLFGFNAGVELGQALVVAAAIPVLTFIRTTRWERRMVWGSSLAILLVGAVLFVERAFF